MKAYELLINTAMYYGADTNRRSINEEDGCSYNRFGKQCALGRFMKPDLARKADSEGATPLDEEPFSVYLRGTALVGIDEQSLKAIQIFHDEDDFWDLEAGRGLTKRGYEKFRKLAGIFGSTGLDPRCFDW